MKTFIFLVTIWHSDGKIPEVYVMADSLSGQECIMFLENYEGPGIASCEIDMGE